MSPGPQPHEIDPVITEAILRGLLEDISLGVVEVQRFEKSTDRGVATLIVSFVEKRGERGGKTV